MSVKIIKVDKAKTPSAKVAMAEVKAATKIKSHKKPLVKVTLDADSADQAVKEEVPDGLARKYWLKSTFNTHDIMHSPVEKTVRMLDKILSGERLFTM